MFAIERSTKPGPEGGKARGYVLAWRGRGYPPHGRDYRSGWYLHRPDAERAASIANAAVDRDGARQVRQPIPLGDGAYLVRLTGPDGGEQWLGRCGKTPDGFEAVRFNNSAAAGASVSHFHGHGPAFWSSERESAARTQREHRDWKAEIVPDADL